MSANTPNRIHYPPQLWLQPVSFDPDAYRRFAKTLDDGLSRLVADHRTRQTQCTRPIMFLFGQADATSSAEDVLPDYDSW